MPAQMQPLNEAAGGALDVRLICMQMCCMWCGYALSSSIPGHTRERMRVHLAWVGRLLV